MAGHRGRTGTGGGARASMPITLAFLCCIIPTCSLSEPLATGYGGEGGIGVDGRRIREKALEQHHRHLLSDLARLRGGRKKQPMYPEDYSDDDYAAWWDKVEAEVHLMKSGQGVDDFSEAQMLQARREIEEKQKKKEEEKQEERRKWKELAEKDEDAPERFDWNRNPDIRAWKTYDEIDHDSDGWTPDMWTSFEYGLRKFGCRWRSILRSRKGRFHLRFLDETDLLKKYRKEKKKNSTWGVHPNFYYYKGVKGKVRKPKQPIQESYKHIVGDLIPPRLYERKPRPPLGFHGFENVYYSNARQGWVGLIRYWNGGNKDGMGGGLKTGRVTRLFTRTCSQPKEAHEAMMKQKEEMGLAAAEEFETKLDQLGLQTDHIVGKQRLKLYELLRRTGVVNQTVDPKWLITPLPLRLYTKTPYYFRRNMKEK